MTSDGSVATSLIGQTLGQYRIIDELGAGGMGVVYKAQDVRLGRLVAVKVLPQATADDEEAVERFLREARAVNQVGHGNVVDVFAVGRLDDGRLYLVMDLLEGEALAVRLRRGREAFEPARGEGARRGEAPDGRALYCNGVP